jgi:hypothetical protein
MIDFEKFIQWHRRHLRGSISANRNAVFIAATGDATGNAPSEGVIMQQGSTPPCHHLIPYPQRWEASSLDWVRCC